MKATTKADHLSRDSQRVFLRPPSANDQEEFIALNRASAGFHRGLVSPPTNSQKYLEYLERSQDPASAAFLICRLEDSAIVGAINLSQIFRGGFQNAYLGYFVGATFAGQGYATQAVQLVLHYAFRELRLHRLEANIQPVNLASIALVRRAGFVREGYSRRYLKLCGRWRDHERWALVTEDWKPLQSTSAQRRMTNERS